VVTSPAPSSGPQLLSYLSAMNEFDLKYGFEKADAAFLSNVSLVNNKVNKVNEPLRVGNAE